MNNPTESDWKIYRTMVPVLRERYLATKIDQITRMLSDSKKTPTERFWNTLSRMEKKAKVLQRCLDRHSRSNMVMSMLAMIQVNMLTEDDLAEFSEELQASLSFAFGED